jgi:GDPmannose 4,6-dehydratase
VKAGQEVVKIDPKYFRPTEVELLIGDPTKAKSKLGWRPKYDLDALVTEMVAGDLELFKRDHYLKEGGHKIFQYHE